MSLEKGEQDSPFFIYIYPIINLCDISLFVSCLYLSAS